MVVRGKYPQAELRNVRITAATSANDGTFGKVSRIQVYNAGVRDLEITVRTFGLDASGVVILSNPPHA